jgi:hypothetical protein
LRTLVSNGDVSGSIRGSDIREDYFVSEIFDDEIRVLTPTQKHA